MKDVFHVESVPSTTKLTLTEHNCFTRMLCIDNFHFDIFHRIDLIFDIEPEDDWINLEIMPLVIVGSADQVLKRHFEIQAEQGIGFFDNVLTIIYSYILK